MDAELISPINRDRVTIEITRFALAHEPLRGGRQGTIWVSPEAYVHLSSVATALVNEWGYTIRDDRRLREFEMRLEQPT